MTRLSEYGEQGVLALFSDSTNSDRRGLSPSESSLYEPLRGLFRRAEQKIIVACFSSSIHRIQILADLASESNRKLLPVGRSMISNIRTATRLGYLRLPTDLVISSGDLRHLPADRIMILAAGSQGEPMSALSRLAVNELKKVKIEEGDTVILSARIIPGNERLISNMVNHFYRRGTSVYDSRFSEVHVSGHGFRDDLKLMINLTRPEFFIPIHGEFRQLQTHAWLAQDQGISQDNIHIIESGDILKLTSHGAEVSGKATVGRRFIEEGVLEEVHDVVLRDRRYLSADGFLLVVVRLDRFSGELIGDPELISRGFVLAESSEDLMRLVRGEISKTVQATPVEEKQDEELFKKILQKHLKRFLRKKTGKRPMIVSVILEI
jgi:ribonuclease J